MINGHEVTPEEFRQYRQTGRLPNQAHQALTTRAFNHPLPKQQWRVN